jgi:hypothetical protein
MTPADLITWAHQETNTVGQPITPAEECLAAHLAEALKGCSVAFLRCHAILNGLRNAELPKLKLDTEEPVS